MVGAVSNEMGSAPVLPLGPPCSGKAFAGVPRGHTDETTRQDKKPNGVPRCNAAREVFVKLEVKIFPGDQPTTWQITCIAGNSVWFSLFSCHFEYFATGMPRMREVAENPEYGLAG